MVTVGSSPLVKEGKEESGFTETGDWLEALLREARIWVKWSAAARISLLAEATSSGRPVITNTGSSPREGVLMYVFVFALRAFILQPCRPTISATCSDVGT
jgi:hypothetical protein